MFSYDEAHYERVAQERYKDKLAEFLGTEQLLNYISTVFFTSNLAIEVGIANPRLQVYMRLEGIRSLIGLTPKFPIFNPQATEAENQVYVKQFTELLKLHEISYFPALGRARDFRKGGDGCFILVNVRPNKVKFLLGDDRPTQLSFTCLYQHGEAELVSCIEDCVRI